MTAIDPNKSIQKIRTEQEMRIALNDFISQKYSLCIPAPQVEDEDIIIMDVIEELLEARKKLAILEPLRKIPIISTEGLDREALRREIANDRECIFIGNPSSTMQDTDNVNEDALYSIGLDDGYHGSENLEVLQDTAKAEKSSPPTLVKHFPEIPRFIGRRARGMNNYLDYIHYQNVINHEDTERAELSHAIAESAMPLLWDPMKIVKAIPGEPIEVEVRGMVPPDQWEAWVSPDDFEALKLPTGERQTLSSTSPMSKQSKDGTEMEGSC